MKIYVSIVFFINCLTFTYAQSTKVAILDFENTSGKSEYDALGKSLSNMLITDLQKNIDPKKIEFFERGQLNKLLEEQQLQKSKNFDAKTAVDFGKLSGVNYVFVGSVFVMDKTCNFSSKLVDVQTSKILFSKDVNGNIEDFLKLESELAETIAKELNSPIKLENELSTSLSTLNQYAKLLTSLDNGDIEKAEELRKIFEETNPEFKYFFDLKDDIEGLKKQVAKNTADIEVLNKSGGRVVNAQSLNELMVNITNPLTSYEERQSYMTEILKFDTKEIAALLGQFSSICNMPSGIELLTAPNGEKVIELYKKDLDFISNLLNNESINKRTLSYYTYYYLRMAWTNKYKSIIPNLIEVCDKLISFNKNHKIELYDVMVYGGGGYAFSSNRGNDLNLSVDHLIELLKKEQ